MLDFVSDVASVMMGIWCYKSVSSWWRDRRYRSYYSGRDEDNW